MVMRFSDLLALPVPAQNPINPLICRSITSTITVAAAAPTLARLAARLHLAVTRECYIRICPIHAPNDAILPIMETLDIAGSWVLAFLKTPAFLPALPP